DRPGLPEDPQGDEPEPIGKKDVPRHERERRYADVRKRLQDVAVDGEHDHRYRLADLLGFHDREAKPQWWEFFDRQDRFEDEWIDDAECLAGVTLEGQPQPVKKSLLHTYHFPAQDTNRKADDQVSDVATLASTGI